MGSGTLTWLDLIQASQLEAGDWDWAHKHVLEWLEDQQYIRGVIQQQGLCWECGH